MTLQITLVVDRAVAHRAERDKVFLGIITRLAAKLLVMDFQIRHHTTRLAPPAITTQH
jgi:hypothetical protein